MSSDFFQEGNGLFTPGLEKFRDGEETSENVNIGKQAWGNPSKCKKNAQQTDCCSDYDTDEGRRRNLNQIPEPPIIHDIRPVDEKEKTESPRSSADCFTLGSTIWKVNQLIACSNIDSIDIETVEFANITSVSEAPIPACNKPVQTKLTNHNNSPTMFFGFTLYSRAFQKKYQQKDNELSYVFLNETRHQILDGNVAQRIKDMHNQECGNDSGIVLLCSMAGVS